MSNRDKKIHTGASVFITVFILFALLSRCRDDTLPAPTVHTIEHHLESNQVDAGGVVVEIRPGVGSISKEHHSNGDSVVYVNQKKRTPADQGGG